jgi:3-deoxy-D-manno-octulosonate 8-phosphate phosphatase KdsC-like HAD superfamily phosphatase
MTVVDAADEALSSALFVTKKKGGEGAVREICDLIISIQG